MKQDYGNLIGIPYAKQNCWDLTTSFYKQCFNTTLTNFCGNVPPERWEKRSLIGSCKGDFVETKNPKFGDIITIMLYGIECHIAIYIGGPHELMLHTTKTTGSCIDRVARWRKVIVAYYTLETIGAKTHD